MLNGSCNCKGVTFEVTQPDSATACHCGQCRKQSGHHWASAEGLVKDFKISGDVRWFAASEIAQRGFCPTCGCFLFWKHNDEDKMSFSLGAIDGPTNLPAALHIFVSDKGDYYELEDSQEQRDQWT